MLRWRTSLFRSGRSAARGKGFGAACRSTVSKRGTFFRRRRNIGVAYSSPCSRNMFLVCFAADETQFGRCFVFYAVFDMLLDTFPERINCAAQTKFLAQLRLNDSNFPCFCASCVTFQPTLKGIKRARKQHISRILDHIYGCAHHELAAYFQPIWKYIWSGSIQYFRYFQLIRVYASC